jgi:molybdopterin-guanine dinucleotide biosynthesis protein A
MRPASGRVGGLEQVAGVVLCGGHGTRMGAEKALIDAGGEPLVLRVARRLSSVAEPVFLATGTPGRLGVSLDHIELADEVPDAGPMGGLAAALAASPHPLIAAVAVDMPFASPELFRLLVRLHAGEDAVVPVTGGGREPLHAIYARACLPKVRRALAEGRLALRGLLEGLTVRDVQETEWRPADPEGRFALNLNRAEDLPLLG